MSKNFKGWIFALTFCAGLNTRAHAAPPLQTITADVSQAGNSDVRESNRLVTRQSESTISLSFLERRAFGEVPWYYSGGLVADSYLFQTNVRFRSTSSKTSPVFGGIFLFFWGRSWPRT